MTTIMVTTVTAVITYFIAVALASSTTMIVT